MREGVQSGGEVKWEVVEEQGDGGERRDVTARGEDNWPADGKPMNTDKKNYILPEFQPTECGYCIDGDVDSIGTTARNFWRRAPLKRPVEWGIMTAL